MDFKKVSFSRKKKFGFLLKMKRKKAKRRKKNELDGIEKEENERKERKNLCLNPQIIFLRLLT